MDRDQLRASIRTSTIGQHLICLDRTTSTNTLARVLADDGMPEGAVVVAGEQTAGRGRLGRRWVAPAGTCLLLSVLFRPNLPPSRIQDLTMVCALAAADAAQSVAGLAVGLKWPNDLVVPVRTAMERGAESRKLAGLLTEASLAGDRVEYVIVGMGINVNVPAAILSSLAPDATSLLAEVGRRVAIPVLLGAVLDGIELRYDLLRGGNRPQAEWAARLVTLGQAVVARGSAGAIAGVAEAVDDGGALLVRTDDGSLHRLTAGDVTIRPAGKVAPRL